MKTTIKHKNNEFLVMTTNIYRALLSFRISLEHQKLWALAHEMAIKRKNDEFLGIPLKHINRPRTQKLWALAHETTIKCVNDEFLSYLSNMYRVLWAMQIPLETQNIGNSS
jgi:hypothetical protein